MRGRSPFIPTVDDGDGSAFPYRVRLVWENPYMNDIMCDTEEN